MTGPGEGLGTSDWVLLLLSATVSCFLIGLLLGGGERPQVAVPGRPGCVYATTGGDDGALVLGAVTCTSREPAPR